MAYGLDLWRRTEDNIDRNKDCIATAAVKHLYCGTALHASCMLLCLNGALILCTFSISHIVDFTPSESLRLYHIYNPKKQYASCTLMWERICNQLLACRRIYIRPLPSHSHRMVNLRAYRVSWHEVTWHSIASESLWRSQGLISEQHTSYHK